MTELHLPPHPSSPPALATFTGRTLVLSALGWSVFAAVEMSVLHLYLPISGQGSASWRGLAIWTSAPMLLWTLYTPGIVALSRRFRVAGRGAPASLAIHLGAALAAHAVTSSVVYALWPWIRPLEARPTIHLMLLQGILLDLLRYALVASAVHAIDYYRMYRWREIESLRLRAELDAARLQVLKMQLQPHFLFNTLHAISELVYRDPKLADRALARLADLLRTMLAAADRHEAPLAEELAFVESYLDIERIRRGGSLEVLVDADAEARSARVPNLVLQPLVENALRHGLRGRPTGTIRITARRTAGALRLAVEDDGRGLPPTGVVEGLGLGSTRVRLAALYGPEATVVLSAAAAGGTRVELTIPPPTPKAAA